MTGTFTGSVDFGGGMLVNVAGGSDIFVVRYSANGSHIWSESFGGNGQVGDVPYAIAVDSNANVLLTGEVSDGITFGGVYLSGSGRDTFVAKLASNGTPVWSKRFASSEGYAVTQSNGNVIVAGHFEGPTDFGGGALTSSSERAFLLELRP